MGAALESAREATAAIEARDWNRVRQLVTDDFVFINPDVPNPEMNFDQWIGMNMMMTNAFPDFNFNFEILEEEGDQVWVATRMEGTHNADLDLSPLGGPVVPPTGKFASAGRSVTVGTVNADGLIQSIEVIEDEGGPMAMLAQIGVDMG